MKRKPTIMQTPTFSVYENKVFYALVSAAHTRPAHDYKYGASRPSLRPVVSE